MIHRLFKICWSVAKKQHFPAKVNPVSQPSQKAAFPKMVEKCFYQNENDFPH